MDMGFVSKYLKGYGIPGTHFRGLINVKTFLQLFTGFIQLTRPRIKTSGSSASTKLVVRLQDCIQCKKSHAVILGFSL